MHNKTVTLSNGVVVPQLALGTWLIDDDKATEAVRQAANLGYRHVDTAEAYANERGVGEGVRTCGVHRAEMFVTTKLAAEHKDYQSAAQAIDGSLEALGLDYIDLMIIHSPQPWIEVNQSEDRHFEGNLEALGLDYIDLMIIHSPQPWIEVNQSEDRHFEGNLEAWRALTDAYKAGKLRAIGVSNFQKEDIDNLWDNAEVKPMVNQVLCHISNTPLDIIEYCQAKGIVMEAYSPVAHGEALKNPTIAKMAEKYGVTVPQLCIRYDLQLNMITLPKTANPEHMRTNADVDFRISAEDMEALKHVEKIESYGDSSYFPVYGGKLKGYSGKPGTEEI